LNFELLRAFHPYLYKYLDMIVRGHVPRYGPNRINQDAKKFLMTMMPKGTPVNLATLVSTCKYLHLAFKGYEPAEIYNILATCLLRVIGMYNPFYVEKVKLITAGIGLLLRRDRSIDFNFARPIISADRH